MKKWLPKLSGAAPAAMHGILFLLCFPLLWQQAWLSVQPSPTLSTNIVPKLAIEQKKLFRGIACLNEVQISLGSDCTFKVRPDLVAEYNRADCPNATGFELIVADQNDKAIPGNILTGEHAGKRLKYFLRRLGCDEAGCWGIIVVEDKNVPRVAKIDFDKTPILCNKIDYILNNPKTIGKLDRTSSPRQVPAGTVIYHAELEDNVPNLGLVEFFQL